MTQINNINFVSKQGKRPSNEDNHNIIQNLNGIDFTKARINLYSIFDGHGGKFVSSFLEKNLPSFFMHKKVVYPLSEKHIILSYDHLNNTLKNDYLRYSVHCGSTCLVVIHFQYNSQDYLNILNTGDSRCVMCSGVRAVPLTSDHKPMWPEEKRRIEELGGEIYLDGADYRIKELSVSRAFGDFNAVPYITHLPDVFKFRLCKNDRFIILACDGLWDVLSNQDVINYILENCYDTKLENRINKEINISEQLANFAIKEKKSSDNVSIIIVFFDQL
jgi:serine/threonine protein phosphatase PrpC